MLYVKMLPYDKSAGRTSHDYTILNPDTGEWVVFKAGDPEWSMVSDQLGEILRLVRQHFFRAKSPELFLVVTQEQADRIDKEEQIRRQNAGRKTRPRRATARDLTVAGAALTPLEKVSGIPGEPEADLVEIEQLQVTVAQQSQQIAELVALVQKLGVQQTTSLTPASVAEQSDWPAPDPTPVSPSPLNTSSRAAALGLVDPPPTAPPAAPPVSLTAIKGVGESTAESLKAIGISSVQDLVAMDADAVSAKLDLVGMTPKRIRGWQQHGRDLLSR